MGFPGAGYSECSIPWLVVYALILLGYVQRMFLFIFVDAVGLVDLYDVVTGVLWPENRGDRDQQQRDRERQRQDYRHHVPQFRSVFAAQIKEALPALRYEELLVAEEKEEENHGRRVGGGCAVCLHELEAAEEVRRLSNCRHVFHRACLDRWVDHGQVTCPLCRAPLVHEEAVRQEDGDFGGRGMWPYAAGMPSAYNIYELYDSAYDYPSP